MTQTIDQPRLEAFVGRVAEEVGAAYNTVLSRGQPQPARRLDYAASTMICTPASLPKTAGWRSAPRRARPAGGSDPRRRGSLGWHRPPRHPSNIVPQARPVSVVSIARRGDSLALQPHHGLVQHPTVLEELL